MNFCVIVVYYINNNSGKWYDFLSGLFFIIFRFVFLHDLFFDLIFILVKMVMWSGQLKVD